MPFTKTKDGKFQAPSGKKFNAKQVALYYATKGFKKLPKKAKVKQGA